MWRWTVKRYDHAAALGWFAGKRVELIEGRVVKMPPQLEPHVFTVERAAKELERVFGKGYCVRRQSPLALSKRSKPEPDIAVVRGEPEDFLTRGAPTSALLVVEVSDKTIRYDLGEKASVYAKLAVAEYWVINLIKRQVERHRDPIPDRSYRFQHRYADITAFGDSVTISSLAKPNVQIRVADLLPPGRSQTA